MYEGAPLLRLMRLLYWVFSHKTRENICFSVQVLWNRALIFSGAFDFQHGASSWALPRSILLGANPVYFLNSRRKVASLVQMFVRRGGHQLQLNAVNRETLLDAQAHPEDHQNLIVRVWGWSAYFVQLDKKYQDHVIARQEYRL